MHVRVPLKSLTILAEIIRKEFLGTFSFVIIFVVLTGIIPPDYFLCNLTATGLLLFVRGHRRDFVLYGDCFVVFTELIAPKTVLL